jgi:hypothetical protein
MAKIGVDLEGSRPTTEATAMYSKPITGRQSADESKQGRYGNMYRLQNQSNVWASNKGEDFQALMVSTLSGPRMHGGRPNIQNRRMKTSMGFSASHTRVNSTNATSFGVLTRP